MTGFFSKLFGKAKTNLDGSPEQVLQKVLDGVIDRAGFDLSYELKPSDEGYSVNFSGSDSKLLTNREGLLIDSFHIFLKRVMQNKFPQQKIEVEVDCDGFLESSAQELRDLAERLKNVVLEKGQPSYLRALPPRERKVVHRYLAQEPKVRSQSVGEGFCKKIKISLSKGSAVETDETFV